MYFWVVSRGLDLVCWCEELGQNVIDIFRKPNSVGATRLRRARLTSIAQLANRFITLGVGFLTVPLAVAVLGREEYGVWLTMVSLITWFAMSDLGLPSALVNPLSAAIGQGNSSRIRELVSTSSLLLASVGLLVTGVGCLLIFVLPIEHILGMSNPEFNPTVRWAFAILILLNVGTLPLRLSGIIASSMQKGYWTAVEETLAELVVLLGLGALRIFGGNLATFALIITVPTALGRLALWLFLCKKFGSDFLPHLRNWSAQSARNIAPHGFAFLVGALGEMLVLQTPYIIIARTLGASFVPLFAIPYQLFYSAYAFLNTLANPMWPAYAEAKANEDHNWIRRTHWRITKESMLFAIVGFSALGILSGWFITLWVGPEYVPPNILLVVLVAQFIQWTWNYVFVILITGLGFIRERTGIVLVFGFLNIALSALLVRHLGIVGVAVALFVAMLLTQTWYLIWITYRKARWIFRPELVPQ
jgi:O-antigen/teichoic acid export membrane protein